MDWSLVGIMMIFGGGLLIMYGIKRKTTNVDDGVRCIPCPKQSLCNKWDRMFHIVFSAGYLALFLSAISWYVWEDIVLFTVTSFIFFPLFFILLFLIYYRWKHYLSVGGESDD